MRPLEPTWSPLGREARWARRSPRRSRVRPPHRRRARRLDAPRCRWRRSSGCGRGRALTVPMPSRRWWRATRSGSRIDGAVRSEGEAMHGRREAHDETRRGSLRRLKRGCRFASARSDGASWPTQGPSQAITVGPETRLSFPHAEGAGGRRPRAPRSGRRRRDHVGQHRTVNDVGRSVGKRRLPALPDPLGQVPAPACIRHVRTAAIQTLGRQPTCQPLPAGGPGSGRWYPARGSRALASTRPLRQRKTSARNGSRERPDEASTDRITALIPSAGCALVEAGTVASGGE